MHPPQPDCSIGLRWNAFVLPTKCTPVISFLMVSSSAQSPKLEIFVTFVLPPSFPFPVSNWFPIPNLVYPVQNCFLYSSFPFLPVFFSSDPSSLSHALSPSHPVTHFSVLHFHFLCCASFLKHRCFKIF